MREEGSRGEDSNLEHSILMARCSASQGQAQVLPLAWTQVWEKGLITSNKRPSKRTGNFKALKSSSSKQGGRPNIDF